MEDLTGKQFGPYQIIAPLGEGGMAAVYKAYQPAMERYVALKVLPRHLAADPEFVTRFQRETKLLAQLQHPHILPVFDAGQAEGYTYLVMPFVESGTLTKILNGQPMPLPRLGQIITHIGEALHYAHARGLIHRDVKPSNVLVDESGYCWLTDFGLARMVVASENLTSTGALMGTPAYMAPEQGAGQGAEARSDIYSLGVILYELATGRVPYKAETPIAVVFKHIQDPLPPARNLNPDLPEAVERVILKALAKRPEDRYQTAGDMVRALNAALSAAPTLPPPVVEQPSAPRTLAQPKRPPTRWLWAGACLVVVIIGIGLLIRFNPSALVTPAPNVTGSVAASNTAASPLPPTPSAAGSVAQTCFNDVADVNRVEVPIETSRRTIKRFGAGQPQVVVLAIQLTSAGQVIGEVHFQTLASGLGYDILNVVDGACQPLTAYENLSRPSQPKDAPYAFDTLRYHFSEMAIEMEIFYTDNSDGQLELRAQATLP